MQLGSERGAAQAVWARASLLSQGDGGPWALGMAPRWKEVAEPPSRGAPLAMDGGG